MEEKLNELDEQNKREKLRKIDEYLFQDISRKMETSLQKIEDYISVSKQ